MKRIKIILFALFISMLLIPSVYAKEAIEIKSIEMEDKSENTTIKSNPKHNGLDMSFDIAFKTKDDYVKYKVVVKNNTDNIYQISEETSFNDSEYIKYRYEVEDVLKAQGETTLHVTITYEKEVDDTLLVDNKYSEETTASVQLLDEKGNVIKVPDTSKGMDVGTIILILILGIILVVTIVMLIIKGKKKKLKVLVGLLVGLSIMPISSAIETLKLNIDLKVEIEKGYSVTYKIDFDGYLKATEMSEIPYDLTGLKCDYTYYNGEINDENKYLGCQGTIIVYDNKLYTPGELVDIKTIEIPIYYLEPTTEETAVDGEQNTYQSEYEVNRSSGLYDCWKYSRYQNGSENPLPEEEIDILNPSNIVENNWNIQRYYWFAVQTPSTIIMPNHNITFELLQGK